MFLAGRCGADLDTGVRSRYREGAGRSRYRRGRQVRGQIKPRGGASGGLPPPADPHIALSADPPPPTHPLICPAPQHARSSQQFVTSPQRQRHSPTPTPQVDISPGGIDLKSPHPGMPPHAHPPPSHAPSPPTYSLASPTPLLPSSQVDINAGGIDLKFPHHENQMAQVEAHFDCCK